MTNVYRVSGFPRLHFGLVDLSGATRRRYGGAGCALDGLPTVMTVRRIAGRSLTACGLSDAAREAVDKALHALRGAGWGGGIHLEVSASPPEHVGLGSTTTAVMCVLRGVAALEGRRPEPAELQRLSGRGRTSGVGVNCFFGGGLVVDAGQRRDGGDRAGYRPSSLNTATGPSRMLMSLPMPEDWWVSLLLDTDASKVHGAAEGDFFRRNTPTPAQESLGMLAELYHGILPSIIERDLGTLSRALGVYQSLGFKRLEILHQAPAVRDLLGELSRHDRLAGGMSSMGPVVFAIHDDPELKLGRDGFTTFGPFRFRNRGHESVPVT